MCIFYGMYCIKQGGVSLRLANSPEEFSRYCIFADWKTKSHPGTYFILDIKWRLRCGDAEISFMFEIKFIIDWWRHHGYTIHEFTTSP